jgi:hypothetical protein
MSMGAGHTNGTQQVKHCEQITYLQRQDYLLYVKKYSEVVSKWDFGN